MVIEFNKVVRKDQYGKIISDTSDLKIENGKMSGVAVDNLKSDILNSISKEIINPQNEAIKQELEAIKSAISENNESLLRFALKKLIEKGADKGVDIVVKMLLAYIGVEL